ncbi:hypothetical protein [Pseudobacteriovorax antillogorgiicola]|uniref:Uncharacterized protein n=1 Tax=Pseudobacteriovorax antillogorgiicola TaxID=1513793 RepID=A0A1Y6CGA1_9BACT|nr:hypothetical protein [Pseudobacteriovorax antillogorgiicola]TCS47306.1 hypothetical protein EDD56_12181 [Pseudobacteriovorax antillogorgiicola]SMF62607.1 hypothetical protein SAMN06296036_12181 [Pseudobacteriovorax antillogorgiicola]
MKLLLCMAIPIILGACENKTSKKVDESQKECSESALYSSAREHQFIYPDHRQEYSPGTVVYQPKTGRVYRCKRYPYSQYCQQWSPSDRRFEPGTGSNWTAVWDLL